METTIFVSVICEVQQIYLMHIYLKEQFLVPAKTLNIVFNQKWNLIFLRMLTGRYPLSQRSYGMLDKLMASSWGYNWISPALSAYRCSFQCLVQRSKCKSYILCTHSHSKKQLASFNHVNPHFVTIYCPDHFGFHSVPTNCQCIILIDLSVLHNVATHVCPWAEVPRWLKRPKPVWCLGRWPYGYLRPRWRTPLFSCNLNHET